MPKTRLLLAMFFSLCFACARQTATDDGAGAGAGGQPEPVGADGGAQPGADGSVPEPVPELPTERPDLTPGDGFSALMTIEQRAALESFDEARDRFADMTLEQFRQDYGPTAAYSDGVATDPSGALNLDLIREVVALSPEQDELYRQQGFAVLKDVQYRTFFEAFIRIYSDDLPLYFSVDAMLDALHLSFDRVLMDLEVFILSDALDAMLGKMQGALEQHPQSGDAEGDEQLAQTLDDAAVWICVARSLLNGARVSCRREVDETVNVYLQHVANETPVGISIFGKGVEEDFSQFKPRGHYTKRESLKRYFRAMMWIQRIGLDFAEYSRHARLAYLLTDLLYRSGGNVEYDTINKTIEALVGLSDSMNAIELRAMAEQAGIASLAELSEPSTLQAFVDQALRSGVAMQYINSTIMMANPLLGPDELTPIPPAYHFMGQRFIVDSYVFTNVVFDRVKDPVKRYMPSPLDTWFVLGNRETVPLLQNELDTYQYQANLATLAYLLDTYPGEFWQDNFYNAWLSALMTLDEDTTSDIYPPAMRTRAWQHRMLNAQLASWAHLRHDTLLYAKPSYTMAECEYPDAWVDPYPEFFQKIADVAELALQALDELGILQVTASVEAEDPDEPGAGTEYFRGSSLGHYYSRLAEVALMLKDIADAELEQIPLNGAQLEFMNQLIFALGGSGDPPFDGWYRDLIYKHTEQNSRLFDPTIADIHTDPNRAEVLHVGTGYPNLMLLSVETDCQLRAYAGPVLSYHETIEGGFNRLDDETWKSRLQAGEEHRPVWNESFLR